MDKGLLHQAENGMGAHPSEKEDVKQVDRSIC